MSADAVAAVLEAIEAPEDGEDRAPLPKRFCFVEGTHVATLRGEMPCSRLTHPAACARDDDDFSFNVIAHNRGGS